MLANTIDIGIVGVVFLTLLVASGLPVDVPSWVGLGLLGALIGGVVLVLLIGLVHGRLAAGRQVASGVSGWFRTTLSEAGQGLEQAKQRGVMPAAVAVSGAMWLSLYVHQYAFVQALSFDLDAVAVLWIQVFLVPFKLLPVKGLADLGTREAAWIAAGVLVGLESATAASLAVSTHVLMFLAAAVYAATAVMLDQGSRVRQD